MLNFVWPILVRWGDNIHDFPIEPRCGLILSYPQLPKCPTETLLNLRVPRMASGEIVCLASLQRLFSCKELIPHLSLTSQEKEGMPPSRAAVREFKDRTICNDKWRSETRSGVSLDTGFNLDAFFRVYLSGDMSFCCCCLFLSAYIGIEFEGFVRKLRIISYKVMDISSSHFCD